jgi:hypothetical protein
MMSIGCVFKSGFWVVRGEKYGKNWRGSGWSFILGARRRVFNKQQTAITQSLMELSPS